VVFFSDIGIKKLKKLKKSFGREERVITFAAPKGKNVLVGGRKKEEKTGKHIGTLIVSIWLEKQRLGADFLWKVL
jgi:hypothetical protein